MKVTLVHAVCAKSGPTMALPKRRMSASAPATVRPGCAICGSHPLRQEFHQSAERAADSGFQPNDKPRITTVKSAAVLAKVNVFWTSLPVSRPRVFAHVRRTINAMATSCSVERLTA